MTSNGNTVNTKLACRRLNRRSPWVLVSFGVLLSGCGSLGLHKGSQDGPPDQALNANDIQEIAPKSEPLSKYGNPTSYVENGKRYYVLQSASGYLKRGTASWYGKKFHGQRTASGEIYNMYAMTAAHKTLPIPSYVKVTNLDNQKSAIVKVNDRGPFVDNRLIDLSYAAAVKLGITANGTAPVEIRTVGLSPDVAAQPPGPPPSSSAAVHQENTSGAHGRYIQVGAFTERQNAERLLKRITFYTSYAVTISQGGANSSFYRVRVGPFSDHQEVKAATAQLSSLGINDTVVLND